MEKFKKIRLFILTIIVALCLSCVFVACSSIENTDGGETEHTHSFTNYTYNNDATCGENGTETAKCDFCNERDTRIKPETATGEHNYINNRCSVCNAAHPDLWTKDLAFTEIVDNGNVVAYEVSKIGEASGNEIYIPAEYNEKPVTSIGNYAFENCSSLTSIVIPNSVTNIGDRAFYGCSSLTSINIPNSVASIGGWVFYNCSSLTSIEIPNSVTSILQSTFYGCSSLTSVEIPNSVTIIGIYAFYGCSSLTSVEIPNSVTIIGNYAFRDCSSLTSIEYDGTMKQWNSISLYADWEAGSGIKTVVCTDGTINL